ncbi:asparagine synthase-related protein, partial [Pseudomonas aeruginosa]|uniref:asparagine synthase-related protein n=1 Tax=Pseudomonas aeruginosa TaxID=287 RepID=UPI00203247B5
RRGRLQRIVGDTAKAPLVALLEQREKRWQAQPKRHFRLPFERWPQALGEMRRHLAERLPALHDLGLEGLDAPSVAALPGDQLFTLTTLSLWQQEYGASL